MSDPAREIIEVLAQEADRADRDGGWSFLLLQRMARCAQRVIAAERPQAVVLAGRSLDDIGAPPTVS